MSWDKKEIKEKLNYLKMRLKYENDRNKRLEILHDKLQFTMMLGCCEGNHLHFFSSIESINNQKVNLVLKEIHQEGFVNEFRFNFSKKDVALAFEISKNIALQADFSKEIRGRIVQDTFEEAKRVIEDFPQHPVKKKFLQMLEDRDKILIKASTNGLNGYSGATFASQVFGESYIASSISPGSLLHEVAHAVHYECTGFIPDVNEYPFSFEIAPYAIQFYDMMKQGNLPEEQIAQQFYLKFEQIFKTNKISQLSERSFSDIPITIDNARLLLTQKSMVMGYFLACEMINNKEQGFSSFYQLITSSLPKEKYPDYDVFGLDESLVLLKSKNFKPEEKEKRIR